ncbi:hypothetical protein BCIN_06g02630 [Botrytis cinerea B05.10]|uniref:Uncharacterized protein n=2 Tax=Botryotinia fuckeliana TaxID=40559 RepID=A0A384JK64_BOTFB|nr:hypothetical protein BCIN_06g02630 [Botrytis cinerea B05.10]ATZ50777.1 hypothetical protein BCIN_06g02630 [Botrytis cinerea B05.10]
MLLTTIIGAIAGIYLLGHTANYYGISPMIIDKVYRTFPSLFPSPKPRSVDPILEAASRMAAERHLLHPRFNYTMRTIFHISGCTVYGYPSTGGIFIKENANIVDMNFLSLDRLHSTPRSPDPIEEDEFCILMRKIGAIWWSSEHLHERQWTSSEDIYDQAGVQRPMPTNVQKIGLVFGWPSKGGVWVLRYNSHKCNEDLLPRDFGRINMAMNMDERVEIMREYNASFYETEQDVEELGDGYWRVEAD